MLHSRLDPSLLPGRLLLRCFVSRLACVVGVLGIAAACSGAPIDVQGGPGSVGGACYPNNTCNAGLACFSHICVAPPGADGGTSDSGDASNDAAAAAYAKAYCGKSRDCFGGGIGFVDLATCVARRKADAADILGAKGTGWTASGLSDCAGQMPSSTCADFALGLSCLAATGDRPDGAACRHGSQCQTGACRIPPHEVCGACSPPKLALESCLSTEDCAPRLKCAASTCAAPGGDGATCNDTTQPCNFGLACRGGACAPAGKDVMCAPLVQDCQSTYYCTETNNTCRQDEWVAPGASCGWINANATLWRDCAGSPGACNRGAQLAGLCPDLVADGEICNSTTRACAAPAVCRSGVCTLPRAARCE